MNDNEKHLRVHIGKKIKLARHKINYTQEALAEELSLSSKYISQLERGVAFGSATTIISLCQSLHINSDFLFNDLINRKATSLEEFIDNKFLESYIQLDDYNKDVILALTNELLRLQNSKLEK